MICPFCAKEITRAEAKAFVYCNRVQPRKAGEEPYHQHSVGDPLTNTDEYTVGWSEFIAGAYKRAARRRMLRRPRVRMISVVGASRAGKTVWGLAVGAHAQCPEFSLYPGFHSALLTQVAGGVDLRKEAIERFPIGTLPMRTEAFRQAMTLPVWLSRSNGKVRKGRTRIKGNGLCFVLKDVAGETSTVIAPERAVDRADLAHLHIADWVVFALDAGDDNRLVDGCGMIASWLAFLNQEQPPTRNGRGWLRRDWFRNKGVPIPRKRGAIVLLTRVDERAQKPDDPVLQAMLRAPCRFRPTDDLTPEKFPAFLNDYIDGMRNVEQTVVQKLRELKQDKLIDFDLPGYFSNVHFAAVSSLGLTPCTISDSQEGTDGNLYEGQCVTQPAMIRVMDPLLWMLAAEGKL